MVNFKRVLGEFLVRVGLWVYTPPKRKYTKKVKTEQLNIFENEGVTNGY